MTKSILSFFVIFCGFFALDISAMDWTAECVTMRGLIRREERKLDDQLKRYDVPNNDALVDIRSQEKLDEIRFAISIQKIRAEVFRAYEEELREVPEGTERPSFLKNVNGL